MALISKQTVSSADRTVTLSAAAEAGDHMVYDRVAKLYVFNDSGSSINVTLVSEAPSNPPTGPVNLVVAVPDGQLGIIGDVGNALYRDAVTGHVSWTYSAHANVSVAVVQGG